MSSTLSGSNTGDWRGFDSVFTGDSQQLNMAFLASPDLPNPTETERPVATQPGAFLYPAFPLPV
jgi:hypothetical protein